MVMNRFLVGIGKTLSVLLGGHFDTRPQQPSCYFYQQCCEGEELVPRTPSNWDKAYVVVSWLFRLVLRTPHSPDIVVPQIRRGGEKILAQT